MRPCGRRRPELDERGSAVLEFHFLGILLLVPLVYVLLAVLDVQRTSYGVTQAAREAARVYAATGDRARAEFAAQVALDDQRVAGPARLEISGGYAPGAQVTVRVLATVALPFVPEALADGANAEIPVDATTTVVIDRFQSS